ncbi:MAG: hypothetical protein KGZ63_01380 [Clostridiales bacterium]|jgi:hypothetical protein|nr:hypothetical protein [Clostridiales bacterium]
MFQIQTPHDIYYFALALLMSLFMIILIPRDDIKRLFGVSFVWGYFGSFVFVIALGGLLQLFSWQQTAFTFLNSPFLLNLAWVPAVMLYLYFLPKANVLFWLYLVTFSLVSAGLDSIFNQLGTLQYINWSPVARFFVAIVWFLGATLHLNYLSKKKITIY